MVRALLAGLSLIAAFPPWGWWPASFIGAGLLFSSLMFAPLRQRFLHVGFTHLIFFAGLLHWTSIYVGSAPWLSLVLLETVLILPLSLFPYRRDLISALMFASLWTMLEVIREKIPFGGFGWGRLGFSQIDSVFAFLLPLGGVTLVSFVLIAISALLQLGRRHASRFIALFALLLAMALIYQVRVDNVISANPTFKVSAVQGGVDLGLDFNRTAQEVFLKHSQLTQRDAPSLHGSLFVLWPENSVDIDPFSHVNILTALHDRQSALQSYLIVGAVLQDRGLRNASLMVGDGKIRRYYKRDLAPFGEYIPLRSLAERVSEYARDVTDFSPGENQMVFRPSGIPVVPLICFEVLDDQFVAHATSQASILAIQTNNATFGRSAEASQQYLINRVRAYELRKPAVIASTTGITAIVDSRGKELDRVKQFDAGVAVASIAPNHYRTLRAKFPWGTESATIVLAFLLASRRAIARRKQARV